jgi:hypothetical protein
MGTVLVFAAIALLILGIAYVNYLNLSAANILTRIKEIRMRKVLGAGSWQLAQQFMIETLLLMVVALGISFLIVNLLESSFEKYSDSRFGLGHLCIAGILVDPFCHIGALYPPFRILCGHAFREIWPSVSDQFSAKKQPNTQEITCHPSVCHIGHHHHRYHCDPRPTQLYAKPKSGNGYHTEVGDRWTK